MPTMKKTHHDTVMRKLIMLGATLALLLGLPFAVASRAFAAPTPKFAYVVNTGDNTVSAYTINSATGALRAVAGSPFAAGENDSSVTVDPSGRFVYVTNVCISSADCSGTVLAYTINRSTGALSKISGSPFAAGSDPFSVTVDPTGRFAYVANVCSDCSAGSISAYTISSSTGALHPVAGSPFAAGQGPVSVAVDPSGHFAYVTNSYDSTVSAYTIDSSTGALSAVSGSPFAARYAPNSVTVDPSGRFAYVVAQCNSDCTAGAVLAYTINSSTGALRKISGSPFAAGVFPLSVAVNPSGQFTYVANYCNGCNGKISAYTINSSTGALSAVAGSPFLAGKDTLWVTVDPSGQFVYVTNENFYGASGNVSAYTIDQSTGALRAVSGSPFPAGHLPLSLAIAAQAVTTSALTITPRSLVFGDIPIRTSSAAQSVALMNTSAKTVAITGIALRGTAPGQFAFTKDCPKSLAAYRTCTLEAIFRPTTKGAKTAYLDVNGGGGGLRSVKLMGTGT
jgi:6-phosphogluconolactonase